MYCTINKDIPYINLRFQLEHLHLHLHLCTSGMHPGHVIQRNLGRDDLGNPSATL